MFQTAPRMALPALLLAALWWGSLSAIGFMAVPLLFAHAPSHALAGMLAARLFAAQGWVSVLSCVGLLMLFRGGLQHMADARRYTDAGELLPAMPGQQHPDMLWFGAILTGLLLALVLQLGIAPRIQARESLALWHSLGVALYGGQWVCAFLVFIKMGMQTKKD